VKSTFVEFLDTITSEDENCYCYVLVKLIF
jgi:hypothetical protein